MVILVLPHEREGVCKKHHHRLLTRLQPGQVSFGRELGQKSEVQIQIRQKSDRKLGIGKKIPINSNLIIKSN